MSGNEIDLLLKIPDARPGEQNVTISKTNITFPNDISLENIETTNIKVRIEKIQKKIESGNTN